MHGTLILMALFSAFSLATAEAKALNWGMGLAVETRMQKTVNPEFTDPQGTPQLFGKLMYHSWAALVELSQDRHDSGSGSLRVATRTTNLNAWGRYEFLSPEKWRPFLSTGLGMYWDEVDTEFAGSSDSRAGRRGLFGLGTGLSKSLWKIVLVELEGRAALIGDDNSEPHYSVLLRLGVQI